MKFRGWRERERENDDQISCPLGVRASERVRAILRFVADLLAKLTKPGLLPCVRDDSCVWASVQVPVSPTMGIRVFSSHAHGCMTAAVFVGMDHTHRSCFSAQQSLQHIRDRAGEQDEWYCDQVCKSDCTIVELGSTWIETDQDAQQRAYVLLVLYLAPL